MADSRTTPFVYRTRGVAIAEERDSAQNVKVSGENCICSSCRLNAPSSLRSRRRALFGLVAALSSLRMLPAMAGDDLLDPTKIGSRKAVDMDGLLDPNRLGGTKGANSTAVAPSARVSPQPFSYAGGMARRVVSSMDSLTRAAANLAGEVIKLDRSAREVGIKLTTLNDEMSSKLDEYRRGLFCSGCGQTKSEILAKGETFPHSGQKIIQATADEIAAKERALQAPIDQLARELRDNRTKRKKAVDERNEAMLQVEAGFALWQTSISFENSLILQDDYAKDATYKAERIKVDSQIATLELARKPTVSGASLGANAKKWTEIKTRLEVQRAQQRRVTQDALGNAAILVNRERDQLNEYLSRGILSQLTTLVESTGFVGPNKDFNSLGGLYRMGNYSLSGRDEILPSVNALISDFRNSPRFEIKPNVDVLPPSPEVPVTQKLKDALKDLLKCNPELGEECTRSKNAGTGVRG